MSGENIYNLLQPSRIEEPAVSAQNYSSPYTGNYELKVAESEKPTYSTFYQKGREYDGSNVRFYKQRDAVIGKDVSDTVDPKNYLRKGEGVRAVVHPIHKEKMYTKPPITDGRADGAAHDRGMGSQGGISQGGYGAEASAGRAAGAGDSSSDPRYASGASAGTSGVMHTGYPGAGDGGDTMGIPKSRKNFIAANIVELSNMVPKNRIDQPQYATDRKDFGKTPAYLSRVKREVAAEQELVSALDASKTQRKQQIYEQYVYRLPAAENARLVDTLKQKLAQKNSALSKMPFSLDTAAAKKKKSELERAICDIETALGKLDKEAVFIYRDDPVNGQWAKSSAMEEAKKYAAAAALA